MANSIDKLRPCPFCGGEAFMVNCHDDGVGVGYYVACKNDNCQGEGNWDLGESGAEYAWNTRPLEDALQAERDKALDELQLRKYKFVELSSVYDELLKERDLLRQQLDTAMKVVTRFANMAYGYYENIPDILAARDALAEIAKLGEKK